MSTVTQEQVVTDPRQLVLTDQKAAFELALSKMDAAQKEATETRMLAEMRLGPNGLEADNSAQLWWLAGIYYRSGAAPVDDMTVKVQGVTKPRPERDVRSRLFLKMTFGAELGLKPLQAIQNVAVINNRPCIWGDAAKAIVLQSGLAEYIYEEEIGKQGTDSWGFMCRTKRKGNAREEISTFTISDAKRAGLVDKNGSLYKLYPQRMLMFRARGFRLRDSYPDVMKGLITAEEATDLAHDRQAPSLDVAFREMVGTVDQSEPPQLESQEGEQSHDSQDLSNPPKEATPPQPDAAKTESPLPQQPPAEDEPITVAQWIDDVGQLNTIGECENARRTVPETISDAGRKKIIETIVAREAAIRGSRGGRSNGTMFDTSASATEHGA